MVRNHAIETLTSNERLSAHSTANSSQRRSERRKLTGPRGRNGCRTCRSRHVRCDETRPTCDNCVRTNRECNWNHDIKLAHDVRSSSFRAALSTHDEFALSDSERVAPAIHQHTARYGYPDFAACIDLMGRGPDGGHRVNIPEGQWVPSAILQHRLEAKLFQFYIDVAGPWLDVTSPSRHFARTVPRLALENPVLLCACLTFAAKAALPENSLSEQYHNACIKLLIPLLSDEVFVSTDETLLATLVILRHVEQYLIVTEDKGAHLSGAFSLIASQRVLPPHDSLPGAALWTYMRQDIRSALLNRTPPKLTPRHGLQVNNLDEPYDVCESVWADRACHLAALACSFAWDSLETYGVDEEHLEILLESWRDGASKDYLPYHDSNAECRFLATWHAVGWQFYHLAKLLVKLYTSKRSRGMDIIAFHAQLEADVAQHVKAICKIAYSTEDIGCRFNATAILGFAGKYLRDRADQQRLLDFLTSFASQTGWPATLDQQRLLLEWSTGR